MSDDIFYVRIASGRSVRKAILESAKDVVVMVQRYEALKKLRQEKKRHLEELAANLRQIEELTSHMNIQLPKNNFKKSAVREKEEKMPAPKAREVTDDNELERLESAISEIEQKLNSMG